jgi:hypothetical protein
MIWQTTDPQLGHYDFIFPRHGRNKRIDPTKAMTSWRSAWRSIRKAAGLQGVRFHDGRHTAITTLAEKGLPDWVIQAQVGHVAPEMMKTYSHIRRQALNQAAAALEPTATTTPAPPETPAVVASSRRHEKRVMSQSTSRLPDRGGRVLKFSRKLAIYVTQVATRCCGCGNHDIRAYRTSDS